MGNAFKVLDKSEIEKPTVLIQWSESENLKNNELMRFGEANEKFTEIVNNTENKIFFMWRNLSCQVNTNTGFRLLEKLQATSC